MDLGWKWLKTLDAAVATADTYGDLVLQAAFALSDMDSDDPYDLETRTLRLLYLGVKGTGIPRTSGAPQPADVTSECELTTLGHEVVVSARLDCALQAEPAMIDLAEQIEDLDDDEVDARSIELAARYSVPWWCSVLDGPAVMMFEWSEIDWLVSAMYAGFSQAGQHVLENSAGR